MAGGCLRSLSLCAGASHCFTVEHSTWDFPRMILYSEAERLLMKDVLEVSVESEV